MEIMGHRIIQKQLVMKIYFLFFVFNICILSSMFFNASEHACANEDAAISITKELDGIACVDMQGIPYMVLDDGSMYGIDAWPQDVLGHYVHIVVNEMGLTSRKVVEVQIAPFNRSHKMVPLKARGIIRYEPESYKGGLPKIELKLDNGKTVGISVSWTHEQLLANRNTEKEIHGILHVLPLIAEDKDSESVIQDRYRQAGEVVYIEITGL